MNLTSYLRPSVSRSRVVWWRLAGDLICIQAYALPASQFQPTAPNKGAVLDWNNSAGWN